MTKERHEISELTMSEDFCQQLAFNAKQNKTLLFEACAHSYLDELKGFTFTKTPTGKGKLLTKAQAYRQFKKRGLYEHYKLFTKKSTVQYFLVYEGADLFGGYQAYPVSNVKLHYITRDIIEGFENLHQRKSWALGYESEYINPVALANAEDFLNAL